MSDTQQETLTFDKHNNILIVAKGSTKYALKEIRKIDTFKEMLKLYGKSKLTYAYGLAKDIGVETIFVANIEKKEDFINVAKIASDYDFSFIVCPEIHIDDDFIDNNDASYKHNYLSYTLGNIGLNKISTIITTGKHASLYETIDDFNNYMNQSYDLFLNCCSKNANLENIIIVGNNLVDNEMADVVLASMLASTQPGEYPINKNLGEAIFNIDSWDYPRYSYFKNHNLVRETTIENLLNCRLTNDIEKIVTISIIKKYIERILDFNDYIGMQYSEYKKEKIREKLEDFLDSVVDILIKKWAIASINTKKEKGIISIVINFEVVPINTIEKIYISKEVEV